MNFRLCLQETSNAEKEDLSHFSLYGYDCLEQGKSCSDKWGLIIYVTINIDPK